MTSQSIKNNPAQSLEALSAFASRDSLEELEAYRAALNGVLEVLSQEDGLIQLQDLPSIIIPDLHARRAIHS